MLKDSTNRFFFIVFRRKSLTSGVGNVLFPGAFCKSKKAPRFLPSRIRRHALASIGKYARYAQFVPSTQRMFGGDGNCTASPVMLLFRFVALFGAALVIFILELADQYRNRQASHQRQR
jgi:hypothetical protein